jgi:hypothetical protein
VSKAIDVNQHLVLNEMINNIEKQAKNIEDKAFK